MLDLRVGVCRTTGCSKCRISVSLCTVWHHQKQKGHQNSLELLPTFNALLLVAGLKHPITAASFGAVYLVGRIACEYTARECWVFLGGGMWCAVQLLRPDNQPSAAFLLETKPQHKHKHINKPKN